MQVAGRTVGGKISGQQRFDIGDHVDAAVAVVAAGDFLQRHDVGAGKACGDAAEIVSPVETEAVLYVIAHQLHDKL